MTDERTPLSTIAELQKHCPRQGAVLRASDRSDRSDGLDGLDEHRASAAAADPAAASDSRDRRYYPSWWRPAFYRPSTDNNQLPPRETFIGTSISSQGEPYYSTFVVN